MKHYCTIGPVPLLGVDNIVAQVESQGWTVRFVLFAGMVTPRLALAGTAQSIPWYAVIAYREADGAEKVGPPKITMEKT